MVTVSIPATPVLLIKMRGLILEIFRLAFHVVLVRKDLDKRAVRETQGSMTVWMSSVTVPGRAMANKPLMLGFIANATAL